MFRTILTSAVFLALITLTLTAKAEVRTWTSLNKRHTCRAEFVNMDRSCVILKMEKTGQMKAVKVSGLIALDWTFIKSKTGSLKKARSSFRVWKNQEGRQVIAEFIEVSGTNVRVKMPNGEKQQLLLKVLSKADKDWVLARLAVSTDKPRNPKGQASGKQPDAKQADTVGQLYNEAKNELSFNKKYLNQRVAVRGLLVSVGRQGWILRDSKSGKFLRCVGLPQLDPATVTAIRAKKLVITITGTCQREYGSLKLVSAEVTEGLEEGEQIRQDVIVAKKKAEELVEQQLRDGPGLDFNTMSVTANYSDFRKLSHHVITFTSELQSLKSCRSNLGVYCAELAIQTPKGGKFIFRAYFDKEAEPQLEKLKVGETVTIRGYVSEWLTFGYVDMSRCVIVSQEKAPKPDKK
ncbi:hypothetical protein IH781_01560 [Patescibacteria group bacterium]|nr:hypothetical protein [Patescibacteria group bacterium]